MNSNQNLIHANNVSLNSNYGLRLVDSSDNKIFHNNFINNTLKNVEQPTNASIGNLWDNFFEGNYWSDHMGEDADKDGISEIPYITDQRTWLGLHSKDNHPLMAPFQRLTMQFQNQLYTIEAVSNSTITEIQYPFGQQNGKENTLTINAIATGNASFYRISVPHILVEPPYIVTINNNSPINTRTLYTNGTRTWIYIENLNTEPTATITIKHQPSPPSPFWTQIHFWEVLAITVLATTLFLINIKYHNTINRQKRLIQLYEEKLQKAHPIVIARELFTADVESRKPKIEKFEAKYGLKIQPRSTFEEIIKGIKSRQKESKKQKNERET
jgi:parallel beta-helix repeat protein